MKIIKISAPLPLDSEMFYGGLNVDKLLTKEEAKNIEQRFGLIQNIGEGSIGVAYDTKYGEVIKLTTSLSEVIASKRVMLYGEEAFAKVYDVGQINDKVYYIRKEKVVPLTLEEERNAQKILTALRYGSEDLSNINQEFIEEVSDYFDKVSNTSLWDIDNASNLGRNKQGELVCFDPMS